MNSSRGGGGSDCTETQIRKKIVCCLKVQFTAYAYLPKLLYNFFCTCAARLLMYCPQLNSCFILYHQCKTHCSRASLPLSQARFARQAFRHIAPTPTTWSTRTGEMTGRHGTHRDVLGGRWGRRFALCQGGSVGRGRRGHPVCEEIGFGVLLLLQKLIHVSTLHRPHLPLLGCLFPPSSTSQTAGRRRWAPRLQWRAAYYCMNKHCKAQYPLCEIDTWQRAWS